ncbi:MAG: multiheme c-type cytochrome [Candidatus Krumholzibacteria bacterium]|jgi:2',3'-cyclic-nucleotide 2'-phosphodiesterase (5'-nucleotidase family)|nr:multiheme c-type cytochrome [Candidatus Krumholzibacteria bacterium]MDP6668962.1 multiheme c-type cytochrome [Candidatus Krumholzibacteria bacterium]MDP6797107.1 multiheme c-type cytochrome [Candidatus Krumholzibacteria bacterium]MDP7022440.1 multiheme c-type cytochrome [Candidatus Krumholzibacteria bacterium]
MEKTRIEKPHVFVFSGGDNFSDKSKREWLRQSYYFLNMMGDLALDAVAIQPVDLRAGIDSLYAIGERQSIPFLCANLRDPEGKTVFPGTRVFEMEEEKLGVIAVTDSEGGRTFFMPEGYQFVDPLAAVEEGVRKLKEEQACTMVVLLYGGKRDQTLEKCEAVPGVDVAFYGNAGSSQRLPAEADSGTRIYTAANRGKDLGELSLTRLDDGSLEYSPFKIHELDKHYPEDPVLQAMVDEFMTASEERRKRDRLVQELAQDFSSSEVDGAYLGTEMCKRCHIREFEVFEASGHAHAMTSLDEALEENNPNCIGCHVTGWGVSGGYGINSENREMLQHVQCEACHGFGTLHSRGQGQLSEARETCAACHDQENSPDFEYQSYWERIAH